MSRPGEVLTTAEVHRLLASTGRGITGRRNRALLYLVWRSGLRCQEALNLRPGDVDVGRATIRVRKGKGGKARTVPMDAGIPAQLEPWLEARRVRGLSRRLLFCTLSGGPVSSRYVRALLGRLGERAGLGKRCHPHALRHTFAFELANEGVPLHAIQALLGHTSLDTTTTYLRHLGAGDLAEIIHARPPPRRPGTGKG